MACYTAPVDTNPSPEDTVGATDDLDARLFSPSDWVDGKMPSVRMVDHLDLEKEKPVSDVTTEESEAARVAGGPDPLSERDLLRAARDLIRQTLLLEQLKKKRRALEDQTAAAESVYQAAHDDLTGSVVVPGTSKAFQVNDKVVVVTRSPATRHSTLQIVPLVESLPVELGT